MILEKILTVLSGNVLKFSIESDVNYSLYYSLNIYSVAMCTHCIVLVNYR
jgi:hypothetical protein